MKDLVDLSDEEDDDSSGQDEEKKLLKEADIDKQVEVGQNASKGVGAASASAAVMIDTTDKMTTGLKTGTEAGA